MLVLTNLNLNKNEIQNAVIQPLPSPPESPVLGQIYFDTTDNMLKIWDGSKWTDAEDSDIEWDHIANKPEGLVIDESYVHTDNNYTTADKNKLTSIAEGAEVNAIDEIKVNGAVVSPVEKSVDIMVPTAADDIGAIPATEKGAVNGVAELDATGKVPSTQLPSYVDDVEEYDNKVAFPETGEAGKIYIAKDTNLTYRWSGTQYVEISASLALGETSSTAFRGDWGKIAYDHSQLKSGNPHNVSLTDLGVTATAGEINGFKDAIDRKADADSLAEVATSGDYEDLINKPLKVTIQEGTITNAETSKAVSVTDATIFSCMVYDSVTFEEVIANIVYNTARTQVTVTVSAAPTNTLNIVVAAISNS